MERIMTRLFMMTKQQHAQIVEALELPSLKTVSMLMQRDAALAMLKAMQPVSECAWAVFGEGGYDRLDGHKQFIGLSIQKPVVFMYSTAVPLYTPEAK
jgi:phosphopentomutase